MKILIAIDILDGKCVRLKRGDFGEITEYSEDPLSVFIDLTRKGVKDFHVIDLDGAKEGKPKNIDVVRKMRESFDGYMQVGGGIRDRDSAVSYLEIGVDRIIVGTGAFTDPNFLDSIPHPERVILSLDLLFGKPMIRGWREDAKRDLNEVIEDAEKRGMWGFLVTSIERDGMLEGPNFDLIEKVLKMTKLPVIASGGIKSISDVEALSRLGVSGVVIGRAIYEGRIRLEDLFRFH